MIYCLTINGNASLTFDFTESEIDVGSQLIVATATGALLLYFALLL